MTSDINEIYKNPSGKVIRVISTQPSSFRKNVLSNKQEMNKDKEDTTFKFGEMLDEEIKKLTKKG